MFKTYRSVALAGGLTLACAAMAAPMAANADGYGRYQDGDVYVYHDRDRGYYRDNRGYNCRERRNDNATGGAVAGAIVGGAAGAVPGAFVGAILGGAIGSEGTRCYYRDTYSYSYNDYDDDYYYNNSRYDDRRYYRGSDYGYRDPYYERRYERRYHRYNNW
ncbi:MULTISPECIES: hypothetical protein [Asticcacaulis]|uniref:hypothetical protein n=1 Tax=Asticcacaulis TaxID=76890 RepID=UPI001AE3CD1B|nr:MULTISPECIES: hypothetical protein [Asticcacaulis]MBP2158377.1 hypothetical protein [Asticcacaulis solisilvae]MDR6799422.1 hypothetical protein [Asticcacaulis sp. BE141]